MKNVLVLLCLVVLCAACVTLPAPVTPGGTGANAPAATSSKGLATVELPASQPLATTPAALADPTRDNSSTCPGVESALLQILVSPDPVAQAKQLRIPVIDGDKVQVLLVLSQPGAGFLAAYGAEAGSQSGDNVQAYVPLARACELARSGHVLAMSLPAQAIPQ